MPEASHDDVATILCAIMEIVQAQQRKITELEQTLDDLHFVHEQEIASINELLRLSFTTREIMRYCYYGTIQELERAFFRFMFFMPQTIADEVLKLSPGLVSIMTPEMQHPRHDWLPSISDEQYEFMKNLLDEGKLHSDTFFGEAVTRRRAPEHTEAPLWDQLAASP